MRAFPTSCSAWSAICELGNKKQEKTTNGGDSQSSQPPLWTCGRARDGRWAIVARGLQLSRRSKLKVKCILNFVACFPPHLERSPGELPCSVGRCQISQTWRCHSWSCSGQRKRSTPPPIFRIVSARFARSVLASPCVRYRQADTPVPPASPARRNSSFSVRISSNSSPCLETLPRAPSRPVAPQSVRSIIKSTDEDYSRRILRFDDERKFDVLR